MSPIAWLVVFTVVEIVFVCVRAMKAYFAYPVISKITCVVGTSEAVLALCLDWPIAQPPTMFIAILIILSVANLGMSYHCKVAHDKNWGGVIKRATRGNRAKQRRIYRDLDSIQRW
jgi:hypothetical protein